MTQTNLYSENELFNVEGSERVKQLSIFYKLKERNHFISREVLYLSIAILDKYLLNAVSVKSTAPRSMLVRAATALWIAWKFLENEHISLSKLASKIDDSSNLKE
jgi:hypothetical protein